MTMRIQEIHPAVVHFPIALLPTAVAFDIAGHLSGDRALMDTGRRLMPVAAASAVVAGIAGLVAQGAVRTQGRAHDQLVTHRTLNIGLTALLGWLAVSRGRAARPRTAHLAAGLAGVAVMTVSGYLGGKMVYAEGVGVEPAGGVRAGAAPEIRRGALGAAARISARHAAHALRHTAEHAAKGELVPALRG